MHELREKYLSLQHVLKCHGSVFICSYTDSGAVAEFVVAEVQRLKVPVAFQRLRELNAILVHQQVPCRQRPHN